MTYRIFCKTKFDITATGVRSHYRSARMPFKDEQGRDIIDQSTWNRSRNKQRNWETVNQVISLRTLPENINAPKQVIVDDVSFWEFSFDIDNIETTTLDDNPVGALVRDCQGVPMILGLDETPGLAPMLDASIDSNIWFWTNLE